MRYLIVFACIVHLFGCQQATFQKRKHLKGFYISNAPRLKSSSNVSDFKVDTAQPVLRPKKQLPVIKNEFIPVYKPQSIEIQTETETEITKHMDPNIKSTGSPSDVIPEKTNPAVSKFTKRSLKQKSHSGNQQRNLGEFAFWFLGFSALGYTLFHRASRKTHRLTFWAQKNSKKSIALILTGLTALFATNLFAGHLLGEIGFTSSKETQHVLMGLTALTLAVFPVKRAPYNFFKTKFKQRSRMMLVLLALLSGLTFNSGIRMAHQTSLSYTESKVEHYFGAKESSKEKPRFEGSDLAIRVVGTVLLILLTAAMIFGLLLLSCSLSCGGQEVLAVVILVFGGAGIVLGLIFSLRAIWRKKPEPQPVYDESNPDPDEQL